MDSGPDLNALLQQATQLQEQLVAAQQEVAETVFHGVSGGGAVRVEVSGGMDFSSVTIAPEAVDPDDVEMLQDLVLAALNDAIGKVHEAQSGAMGSSLGGLGLGGLLPG